MFPQQQSSTKENLEYIRKESLDIYNRLHSIQEDIRFVGDVFEAYAPYNFPLLPNLRCGAWYTDPLIATDIPAYFKSTDGHFNNWGFNLRRANLHLLDLLVQRQGLILVDSTRTGKRIPDALSKTVPIWCAVINRAIRLRFPESSALWDTALYTPPQAVSIQEKHLIEKRLDEWAVNLTKSTFTIPRLALPLRPLWITPSTSVFPSLPPLESLAYHPVICVSASQYIEDAVERRSSGFSYIQGSGDDHELWGQGLSPNVFWENRAQLLAANRFTLPELVKAIVSSSHESARPCGKPTPITKVGGRILICATDDLDAEFGPSTTETEGISHIIIHTGDGQLMTDSATTKMLHFYIPGGKKGQTQLLRNVLPASVPFLEKELAEGKQVCISCSSGTDTSVGVALVALQMFFDDNGNFISEGRSPSLGKCALVHLDSCLMSLCS